MLLIGAGLAVLAFGTRLFVLGAGVGALLGVGLLRFLPGTQSVFISLLVPVGLAIVCALGTAFIKVVVDVLMLALGALAGAAIALALLDLFGISFGVTDWLFILAFGIVGLIIAGRYKSWAVILIAALVGALLTTRGLQLLLPWLQGPIATLVALILAGGGIAYHGGWLARLQRTVQT
jgi:hypothetical protein